MRKPRSRTEPTTPRNPQRVRELSAKELARASGGNWVAYTDDGTTLIAMTDRGDTY